MNILIVLLGALRPLFFIMRFFLESIHWKDMEDYALHWSIPLRSHDVITSAISFIQCKRKYKYGTISISRFVTSRNRYGTIASLNFTLRYRIDHLHNQMKSMK